MSRFTIAVLAIVSLGVCAVPALAVWDVSADFGPTNPSGAWSYGYSEFMAPDTYRFQPDTGYVADFATYPGGPGGATGAIEAWWMQFATPVVLHNKSNVQWDSGWFSMRANEVALHPGVYAPEFSIVRWKAPAAGKYLVSGKFLDQVWGTSTNDVHILLNKVSIFDGLIDGYDPNKAAEEAPFSLTLDLLANDKVDFLVGYGPDRSFSMGLCALQAKVDAVPEPSSFVALAGLFGTGLALLRRRTR